MTDKVNYRDNDVVEGTASSTNALILCDTELQDVSQLIMDNQLLGAIYAMKSIWSVMNGFQASIQRAIIDVLPTGLLKLYDSSITKGQIVVNVYITSTSCAAWFHHSSSISYFSLHQRPCLKPCKVWQNFLLETTGYVDNNSTYYECKTTWSTKHS